MHYRIFVVVAVVLAASTHAQSPPSGSSSGKGGDRHEGERRDGDNIVQIQSCLDIKQSELTCVNNALKSGTPSVDLTAIKSCFATCQKAKPANPQNADPKRQAFEKCMADKAQACIQQGATGVNFAPSADRPEHSWGSYGLGGKNGNADIVGRLLNASSKCGPATQTCVLAALPPNAQANSAALSAQFKTSLCTAYTTCNASIDATKRATCVTQRGLVKQASCTCRTPTTRQANAQACSTQTGFVLPPSKSGSASASRPPCSSTARPEKPRSPKFCPAPSTANGK
jgi:hypothetical protein